MLVCISIYNLEQASHCHFERAQRVEKSKSCKYNKYPGPRPRKQAYFWPSSLFLTPRPRKGSFFRPPESQSKLCLSWESSELRQGSQINWEAALTINSDESCDIFLANSDTAVGKILSNELKSTELCQKIKKYCHSARNINSQINWNL